MATLIENRRARADYIILETYEAGIALTGPEVKMLRLKRGSLVGSHVRILNGRPALLNLQIPPYPMARQPDYDPQRTRFLLLHKSEVIKLQELQETKGLTLIPLEIYAGKRTIKVRIAVAKGKKLYERREELRRRDMQREADRSLARQR